MYSKNLIGNNYIKLKSNKNLGKVTIYSDYELKFTIKPETNSSPKKYYRNVLFITNDNLNWPDITYKSRLPGVWFSPDTDSKQNILYFILATKKNSNVVLKSSLETNKETDIIMRVKDNSVNVKLIDPKTNNVLEELSKNDISKERANNMTGDVYVSDKYYQTANVLIKNLTYSSIDKLSVEEQVRQAREDSRLSILRSFNEEEKKERLRQEAEIARISRMESDKIRKAAEENAAKLAIKNSTDIARLEKKRAAMAAKAANEAELLAKQTGDRIAEIEAAKKRGIAEAAAASLAAAQKRLSEDRERRSKLRDMQRLREWDEVHNISYKLDAPKYDSDSLKNDIDAINNKIILLENGIFNKTTSLGACPDGWTLIKRENNTNFCSMKGSGNYTKRCKGISQFKVNETDKNKRIWARACRVNWINRAKMDVGDQAPLNYNIKLEQMVLYNKLKKLLMIKSSILSNISDDFNKNTAKLDEHTLHINKGNIIVNNQEGEINNNKEKLRRLENDISTLSRKIQIAENSYKRKTYLVYVLKYLFVFMLIWLLIGLLVKNNNISKMNGLYLGVCSLLALVGSILYEIWKNNRSAYNVFFKNKENM
tara:strand:- start:1352 stop:3145 length:1794 start_codon:yes stop_codon:yes gene_type:complete